MECSFYTKPLDSKGPKANIGIEYQYVNNISQQPIRKILISISNNLKVTETFFFLFNKGIRKILKRHSLYIYNLILKFSSSLDQIALSLFIANLYMELTPSKLLINIWLAFAFIKTLN